MIISRFLSFVVGAPWIPLQSSVNPPVHLRPRIPILQYCSDWVCVNKPAGISVHPNLSPSRRRRRNEEETHVLTSRLKRQLHRKVLPVHRLDHRTSGAILMAFTSETAAQLQTALHEGSKRYLALVRGEWTHVEPSITINTPILMHDIPKRACTKFTLIASRSGSPEFDFYDRCSLLWCEPLLTGRTHQIRRHAAAMGHPIVGDTEHGDTHINRWWRTTQGLDRLLLHCWSLDITKNWPMIKPNENDKEMSPPPPPRLLVAPLPSDFASVLHRQGEFWDSARSKEPCLEMEWIDERGGTFGRHYRRRNQLDMMEADPERLLPSPNVS